LSKEQHLKHKNREAMTSAYKAITNAPCVGTCFINEKDSLINKLIKIIKPYLVCLYYAFLSLGKGERGGNAIT